MARTEQVDEVEAFFIVHVVRSAFAILLVPAFQLIGPTLIDHLGVLDPSPIALSGTRLLGLGLLIGGGILVVTDRDAVEDTASEA